MILMFDERVMIVENKHGCKIVWLAVCFVCLIFPFWNIFMSCLRHHNTCNDQVITCPIPSSILIIPFQPTPSTIWIAKQFRYQYRCSFCFNQLAPYRQGLCYSKRIITIQGFSTPGWRYRSCSNSFQIWLPYFLMQIMKQPVWIPQLPAEWIKW